MRAFNSPNKQQSYILKTPEDRASSTDELLPLFTFCHIKKGYSVKDCTPKECVALLAFIVKISSQTWQQIKQNDRKSCGYEKIYSLSSQLPDIFKGATPIAFRFNGNDARLIGVRNGEVFHIVWIDTKLKAYDH